MSEANNGHSLSQRGNYTGERLSARKAQGIINALARGEPVERIARQLHTSKHTVMSVREREWHDIARRKQLIAASAARLAANGFDRLNAEMDAGNIKGALLVPVTGMATDKVIALSGDARASVMNLNLNLQPADLLAGFRRLHEAIEGKPAKANKVNIGEMFGIKRPQLALPGCEVISDSGAETSLKAENRNG